MALRAIYRSSLDGTVRKLHIARKYMFCLLYYTEYNGLKNIYCKITTNKFNNHHMI